MQTEADPRGGRMTSGLGGVRGSSAFQSGNGLVTGGVWSATACLPLCGVAIPHCRSLLRPNSLSGCGRPTFQLFPHGIEPRASWREPASTARAAASCRTAKCSPPVTNALPSHDKVLDSGQAEVILSTQVFMLTSIQAARERLVVRRNCILELQSLFRGSCYSLKSTEETES